ncbi:MAG: hypothetical protein LBQ84_08255 [Flavobacteriaceae bacterium]|jgi:hypothetical protein|nr:hypothetical protein [Flavobacteriaceae bacterium]
MKRIITITLTFIVTLYYCQDINLYNRKEVESMQRKLEDSLAYRLKESDLEKLEGYWKLSQIFTDKKKPFNNKIAMFISFGDVYTQDTISFSYAKYDYEIIKGRKLIERRIDEGSIGKLHYKWREDRGRIVYSLEDVPENSDFIGKLPKDLEIRSIYFSDQILRIYKLTDDEMILYEVPPLNFYKVKYLLFHYKKYSD